jgi:hypothetical protein
MTRNNFQFRLLLLLLAVLILVPAGQAIPGTATITYRRVFKGSSPEFIEIKVGEQGKCTYEIRQLTEESGAETFEVGPAVREKLFELTAELKNFAINDLDAQKRIADLGQKTFRYERDTEVHEVSFNYTLNPSASHLLQIFEGLARQQGDLITLERSAKYDRLGVNDALRQFASDLGDNLIPEPERILPVLDQIAADSRFVEIARTRARALAARIRAPRGQ